MSQPENPQNEQQSDSDPWVKIERRANLEKRASAQLCLILLTTIFRILKINKPLKLVHTFRYVNEIECDNTLLPKKHKVCIELALVQHTVPTIQYMVSTIPVFRIVFRDSQPQKGFHFYITFSKSLQYSTTFECLNLFLINFDFRGNTRTRKYRHSAFFQIRIYKARIWAILTGVNNNASSVKVDKLFLNFQTLVFDDFNSVKKYTFVLNYMYTKQIK